MRAEHFVVQAYLNERDLHLTLEDRLTDSYKMINDESLQKNNNKKTKLQFAFYSHPSFSSCTEWSVTLCLPEPPTPPTPMPLRPAGRSRRLGMFV